MATALMGDNTLIAPPFTAKYTLMLYISIGFVVLWLVVGTILAIYVYKKTVAYDQKANFAGYV